MARRRNSKELGENMEIPNKIKKDIKEWSVEFGCSVKELLSEIVAEMKELYVKELPKDARLRSAWNSVKAKHARGLQIPTQTCLIFVDDKTDTKQIITKKKEKMLIANAWGLIQLVDDDEAGDQIFYMRMTGMRNAAKVIDQLEKGKSYQIDLAIDGRHEEMIEVNPVENRSKPVEIEMEIPEDPYSNFPLVDLADAGFNLSETPQDIKRIRGNVISARTPTGSGGNPYGVLVLMDDSMDLKSFKETGGVRVYCDASQITMADGSDVEIIGTLQEGARDKKVQMQGDIIKSLMHIPREVESIEDEEEIPEIDDEFEDMDLTGADEDTPTKEEVEEETEETKEEEPEAEELETEEVDDEFEEFDEEDSTEEATEEEAEEGSDSDLDDDDFDLEEENEPEEKPKPKPKKPAPKTPAKPASKKKPKKKKPKAKAEGE